MTKQGNMMFKLLFKQFISVNESVEENFDDWLQSIKSYAKPNEHEIKEWNPSEQQKKMIISSLKKAKKEGQDYMKFLAGVLSTRPDALEEDLDAAMSILNRSLSTIDSATGKPILTRQEAAAKGFYNIGKSALGELDQKLQKPVSKRQELLAKKRGEADTLTPIYSKDGIMIYHIPPLKNKTDESALKRQHRLYCKYGANTQWCTAKPSWDVFKNYVGNNIYIIHKDGNPVYQYVDVRDKKNHQFRDVDDNKAKLIPSEIYEVLQDPAINPTVSGYTLTKELNQSEFDDLSDYGKNNYLHDVWETDLPAKYAKSLSYDDVAARYLFPFKGKKSPDVYSHGVFGHTAVPQSKMDSYYEGRAGISKLLTRKRYDLIQQFLEGSTSISISPKQIDNILTYLLVREDVTTPYSVSGSHRIDGEGIKHALEIAEKHNPNWYAELTAPEKNKLISNLDSMLNRHMFDRFKIWWDYLSKKTGGDSEVMRKKLTDVMGHVDRETIDYLDAIGLAEDRTALESLVQAAVTHHNFKFLAKHKEKLSLDDKIYLLKKALQSELDEKTAIWLSNNLFSPDELQSLTHSQMVEILDALGILIANGTNAQGNNIATTKIFDEIMQKLPDGAAKDVASMELTRRLLAQLKALLQDEISPSFKTVNLPDGKETTEKTFGKLIRFVSPELLNSAFDNVIESMERSKHTPEYSKNSLLRIKKDTSITIIKDYLAYIMRQFERYGENVIKTEPLYQAIKSFADKFKNFIQNDK
jgi:hypothetical protein